MTHEKIAYAFEVAQWAGVGALLGLMIRPVFNRRVPYHRRSNRRDQ